MPTYGLPDDDVLELVAKTMERHHQPLHLAEVKIGVLMCSDLRHGGYPAYATIKVVPLKDRLTKEYDAELVIDRHSWDHFREKHRRALIDHELSHLSLAKFAQHEADDGEISVTFSTDDIGRPKLKLLKGDWNGGDGFREVVKRHGNFAIEFLNAKRCHTFATAARDGIDPKLRKAADDLLESIDKSGMQATFTLEEGEPH